MDLSLAQNQLYPYILVFARMAGMFMFLPGFSAAYIPNRIRAALVVFITLVIGGLATGVDGIREPSLAVVDPPTIMQILHQLIIGTFFGLSARLILLVLDITGAVSSLSSSLSAASLFNPSVGEQTPLLSSFFMLFGVVIIFVADAHYLFIEGILHGYDVMPLPTSTSEVPPWGDMAQHYLGLVSEMFLVGVQLASPVLLVAIVFSISLALLNRLMPTLQVFFVGLPAQITLSFAVIAISISAVIGYFITIVQNWSVTGSLV